MRWEWQAADTVMGKVRFGGNLVGPNPTDHAKPGMRHSLLVEANGDPLGVAVAGANVPDAQSLATMIEAIVVERPAPDCPQHLCLDKGYDNSTGWAVIEDYDHQPHLQLIHDLRTPRKKRYRPRRWPSVHWLGSRSAARSWSAGTRKPSTVLASSSWPVPYCGSAVTTAWR